MWRRQSLCCHASCNCWLRRRSPMSRYDLVVRGGTVVTPERNAIADIGVADGRIVEIGPELAGGAAELDAAGLHVFPGVIDAHVHFNEPGRAEWEGIATGS